MPHPWRCPHTPSGTTRPLAVGSQSERACGRPIETIFHDSRTIHMVVQQVVARAPAGHQPQGLQCCAAGTAFPTFLRIITDTARTAQANFRSSSQQHCDCAPPHTVSTQRIWRRSVCSHTHHAGCSVVSVCEHCQALATWPRIESGACGRQ